MAREMSDTESSSWESEVAVSGSVCLIGVVVEFWEVFMLRGLKKFLAAMDCLRLKTCCVLVASSYVFSQHWR